MENINQIKLFTEQSFKDSIVGKNEKLKSIVSFYTNINQVNPQLGEVIWNDFSYEWNKNQAKFFLKKEELIDADISVKKFPSIWLMEWNNVALKGVKKLGIEKSFDLRSYSFSNFHFAVQKLEHVFSHLFINKSEKDLKDCIGMSKDILNSSSTYENTKKSNEDLFINTVFNVSLLKYFSSAFNNQESEQKEIVSNLIDFYYCKQNKDNRDLFTNYFGVRDIQSGRDKEILKIKEKDLEFRDEDKHYWKFFLSFIPENLFLDIMIEKFDLSQKYGEPKDQSKSIVLKNYRLNNVNILNDELPKKENVSFKNKIIKV